MSFLASLTPDTRAELAAFVDERVAEALALRDREPQKRWLSVREAADYLGCSPRAVHQRLRRQRIPPAAVRHSGRSVLIDRQIIDRALERQA